MRSLAVIPIATGVLRTELLQLQQERDEPFRAFGAKVREKAETCEFTAECECGKEVDYTNHSIRDVLLNGIYDPDIRREVLGTKNILKTSVNDVIALVENKEMARNALPSSNLSAVSSFQHLKKRTNTFWHPDPISRRQGKRGDMPRLQGYLQDLHRGSEGLEYQTTPSVHHLLPSTPPKKAPATLAPVPDTQRPGRRIRAHLPDWWCPDWQCPIGSTRPSHLFKGWVEAGPPTGAPENPHHHLGRQVSTTSTQQAHPHPHSPCRGLGHCRYRRSIQLMVTGRFPSPRILSWRLASRSPKPDSSKPFPNQDRGSNLCSPHDKIPQWQDDVVPLNGVR